MVELTGLWARVGNRGFFSAYAWSSLLCAVGLEPLKISRWGSLSVSVWTHAARDLGGTQTLGKDLRSEGSCQLVLRVSEDGLQPFP